MTENSEILSKKNWVLLFASIIFAISVIAACSGLMCNARQENERVASEKAAKKKIEEAAIQYLLNKKGISLTFDRETLTLVVDNRVVEVVSVSHHSAGSHLEIKMRDQEK